MLAHYNLNETEPVVMTILLGRGDYRREETLGFIEKLARYQSFKFVVFLDRNNKLVAYMRSWAIRQLLSKQEFSKNFLSIVNRSGGFTELLDYPHVLGIEATLGIKDDNENALRKMTELKQDAIVAVDEKRHVCGVIEQAHIINQLILTLAEQQGRQRIS